MAIRTIGTEEIIIPKTGISPQIKTSVHNRAMAFIPRKCTDKPALLVELKWDQSPQGAIQQIKERKYAGALEEYKDNLLLVGISYDRKSKKHACVIEKYVP